MDLVKTGKLLQELRKEKGLTQEQPAEQVGGYPVNCRCAADHRRNDPEKDGGRLTEALRRSGSVILPEHVISV